LFFDNVRKPNARDLARLDLTEAALASLEPVLATLPGERRPREDERLKAAFEIGKAFADYVTSEGPVDAMIGRTVAAIGDCLRLTKEERRAIVVPVVAQLVGFVEEVCSLCPVGCLDNPKRDVAQAFFSLNHPARAGLGGEDLSE